MLYIRLNDLKTVLRSFECFLKNDNMGKIYKIIPFTANYNVIARIGINSEFINSKIQNTSYIFQPSPYNLFEHINADDIQAICFIGFTIKQIDSITEHSKINFNKYCCNISNVNKYFVMHKKKENKLKQFKYFKLLLIAIVFFIFCLYYRC